MIQLDWLELKSFLDTNQLAIKEVNRTNEYRIHGYDKDFKTITVITKTNPSNADQIEYEASYRNLANLSFRHRVYTQTFTATGMGVTKSIEHHPMKHFAIRVVTNGIVGAWVVRLQVDIDGTQWTTIGTHTTTSISGQTLFITTPSPALFIRANCTGLDLGLGTGITVTILGMD